MISASDICWYICAG